MNAGAVYRSFASDDYSSVSFVGLSLDMTELEPERKEFALAGGRSLTAFTTLVS